MNLEHRYIVFKIADLEKHLCAESVFQIRYFSRIVNGCREGEGRPALDGIFIEADWPEFRPTVDALLARIKGESGLPVDVPAAVEALERIANLYTKMMCSASVMVDKSNNVIAYRINTGAAHEMLGVLQASDQPSFIPSQLPTWDMDFYGRCWSAFRFKKDLTREEVGRIQRIEQEVGDE